MRRNSITKRWLFNSLGVMVVVLFAVVIAFAVTMQNYYYSAARQYISVNLGTYTAVLTKYAQSSNVNFSSEVKNTVENFSEKDRMELMVIGSDGSIKLTSSGFTPSGEPKMQDYYEAIKSQSNFGYYVGKSPTGEKIMAVCSVIPGATGEYKALRMVISMEQIDKQLSTYIIGVSLLSFLMIVLMISSGLYFVKSIVIPVGQLGVTARRFATGDFSVRIVKKNDDEIGELCDMLNYMADELSNSEALKNEFISSVSHELRTPLTAIKGWAETLQEIDDPETHKKGMKVITNEAERLSRMVEELLDFSRMQDGKLTLVKETTDILAELGEAVLIYEERARQLGIKIYYDEPEMLPFVYGDSDRLRQVFINIIDNAIKYSSEGGVVTVDASAEGGKIQVIVSDTGCGISEKDLPRIKTKFYKANNTVKGSGIGLAVANEIIMMHNGTLDIVSEFGKGTTVNIVIPAISQPARHFRPDNDEEKREVNE
ncbi:MAG: HAMP domain-containing histidine kinase [Ruminococcus sp.]|nr:HAMP domain-containing histidine kinase [Ruminococcus sp.]